MIQLEVSRSWHQMNKRRLWHREIDCKICQHDWTTSPKSWWNQNQHLLAVTAEIPTWTRSSTSQSTKGKAQFVCALSQRRKLKRAACRRNLQSLIPRAYMFGDIIAADHKSPHWRWRIEEQPKVCNCCARCNHSLDSTLPMLNQNFTRNSDKFTRVSRSRKIQSYIYWQFIEIRKNLWRSSVEPFNAIVLKSGLDEQWWAESMECDCFLRSVQDLLSDWKVHMNGALKNSSVVESYHSEQKSNIIRFQWKIRRGSVNLARK